jgi:integrase
MTKSQRSTFGNTRQLPSRRWQARWRDIDGVLHNIKGTFTTQRAAEDALAQIRVQVRTGTWEDERKGDVLFKDFAEQTLKVMASERALRTTEEYRRMLRLHIYPTFGHRPIGSITKNDVKVWRADLLSRLSAQHTRNIYMVAKGVMTQAVDGDVLKVSPFRVKNAGAAVPNALPTFEVEHVRSVIEAAPAEYRAMLWLTFSGHLRLGELLALTRDDYDKDTGKISVTKQYVPITVGGRTVERLTKPKHGSIRTLVVLPRGREEMVEYLKANPMVGAAPLFTNIRGERITRHQVIAIWNRARKVADLDKMRFHDLRHVSLTLMATTGISIKELMRRAGHATEGACLGYLAASDRRDAELAEVAGRRMA